MKLELYVFNLIDSPLSQYASDVTSQSGEDGIIARIVEVLNPPRYCVEFGACDGKHHSNCYNLIANRGWRGILIESDRDKYQQLARTYRDNPRATTVNRLVDVEGSNSLDNILEEFSAPHEIGVVSIDIDGNDYYVWEALTRHTPELVVIEFNVTIPNDVLFVQDKSFDVNQGCSLLALVMLGKQKGYELAVCTTWNALFVKREKLELLGVKDNFIMNLYKPLHDGRIFQGYDGYIYVAGMTKLVWQDAMPLTSENFQVLPKAQRVWRDAQKK